MYRIYCGRVKSKETKVSNIFPHIFYTISLHFMISIYQVGCDGCNKGYRFKTLSMIMNSLEFGNDSDASSFIPDSDSGTSTVSDDYDDSDDGAVDDGAVVTPVAPSNRWYMMI